MMSRHWTVSLAACTAAILYGALLATAAESTFRQDQPAIQGSTGIIRSSTLTGTTVLDPQSQKLGRIKDVLLDSQTGQANFVVLDMEAPGPGHAMLVVPYQALRVSLNSAVVLDLRPDQVRAAPQIQNNQWQILRNPQFLEQARNFYQIRTYSAARPIENPSVPYPPVQYAAPRACVQSRGDSYADWPQSLIDFSSE